MTGLLPHSHGVLEVIRWFQLQPKTYVGLNTGRPESIRADTLRSLNKLGKEYRVQFSDELLHKNRGGEVDSNIVALLQSQNSRSPGHDVANDRGREAMQAEEPAGQRIL